MSLLRRPDRRKNSCQRPVNILQPNAFRQVDMHINPVNPFEKLWNRPGGFSDVAGLTARSGVLFGVALRVVNPIDSVGKPETFQMFRLVSLMWRYVAIGAVLLAYCSKLFSGKFKRKTSDFSSFFHFPIRLIDVSVNTRIRRSARWLSFENTHTRLYDTLTPLQLDC